MKIEVCEVCEVKLDPKYCWDEKVCEDCIDAYEYRKENKKKIERLDVLLSKSNNDELDKLAHELHTASNCNCDEDAGTYTLRYEGAGDMEMCLYCYGARGCVY